MAMCDLCGKTKTFGFLGEASVRGIHPDDVRRELLWPGVRP